MKILRKAEKGLAQLVVLGLMTLMAVALPVTTKLVQRSQENRSNASGGEIFTCDTLRTINSRYFDVCADFETICFNKYTGVYQGCGKINESSGGDCTDANHNANAENNMICPVNANLSLSCDYLHDQRPRYFALCDGDGYGGVCFDKQTGEFEGCVKKDNNDCTDPNKNSKSATHVLCSINSDDSSSWLNAGGKCGAAYGKTFEMTPTTDLCEFGDFSRVWFSPNDNRYYWRCGNVEKYGNETANCFAVVKGKMGSSKIKLDRTELSLGVGQSLKINATLDPVNSSEVIVWSSNMPDFFSVDSNGVVTALKGSASGNVTAMTLGGYGATVRVDTSVYAEKIDGVCGSANGKTFSSRPEDNLCVGAVNSSGQMNGNRYVWTCYGANGGISTECFATIVSSKNTSTPTPSPVGRKVVEGNHIILDLDSNHASVITDENLRLWVSRLDSEYEALSELTGYKPFSGRKITIKEYKCDENGYGDTQYACMYWAWAGEVTGWAGGQVEGELKKINDMDDWSFGILHEISHSFDIYGWNFDGELMANFKMAYFLQKSGGKVWQNNRFYAGDEIKDFYKISNRWGYNDVLVSGEYASDFMAYKLLEIKDKIGGWDTYKKTFVNLTNSSYIGNLTDLDELNIFLNELTKVSGVDVRSLFTDREKEIIKSKFGGGFDTIPSLTPIPILSGALTVTPTLSNIITGKPYSSNTTSCKSRDGICAKFSKALSTGVSCQVSGYDTVGTVKTGLCPGNTKVVCCTNINSTSSIGLINGKCGNERNTCKKGIIDDDAWADTSSFYRWKCLGLEGGKNVKCSLNKPVDGKCGSKKKTCASGTVNDKSLPDTSTKYKWKCIGQYGGKTVSCSLKK